MPGRAVRARSKKQGVPRRMVDQIISEFFGRGSGAGSMRTLTLTRPEGVEPGAPIPVTTPEEVVLHFTCPEDKKVGESFQVQYQPNSTIAFPPH